MAKVKTPDGVKEIDDASAATLRDFRTDAIVIGDKTYQRADVTIVDEAATPQTPQPPDKG